MLKHIFYIIFLGVFAFQASAQHTDEQLATQYMYSKDFDKAVVLFEQVYSKKPTRYVYLNYLNCLFALKEYKQAEKLVRKQIKLYPEINTYKVDLGYVFTLAGESSKADKTYTQLIQNTPTDEQQIVNIAKAFEEKKLFQYAISTYLKGEKLFKNNTLFNLDIASVYLNQGDYKNMMTEYLDLIQEGPEFVSVVQLKLQQILAEQSSIKEIIPIIHESLLRKIQQQPDKVIYAEMLLWFSIQQGDFNTALIQAKALDKRLKENGERLLNLANECIEQKEYTIASQCLQYIIDKGPIAYNYSKARIEWLNVAYIIMLEKNTFTKTDILQLEQKFNEILLEVGKSVESIYLIKKLAYLKAFYLNKVSEAIVLLEETEKFRMPEIMKAECKMELADILLFSGQMWDASLFYSQVEKAFPDDPIGHLAKFQNAKLTFYAGEFLWSKAQLDVLRASTSKLIANDAMQLSLMIGDNITADSSFDPLSLYASADLFSFRLQDDSALYTLDHLEHLYPAHPIIDDVLLKKAEIYKRKGEYAIVDSLLKKIVTYYPTDILADDALYQRGLLQELTLKNTELAKEIYFNLITDYPASIFVVEARKRFRKLRGDIIN